MKSKQVKLNNQSLPDEDSIKPWWPLVTLGLVLFIGGVQIAVYLWSKVDGEILILSFGAATLLSAMFDVLASCGVINNRWSSESCRKIFFTRPFSWCYLVLAPYLCSVVLLFVPIKLLITSIQK